MDPIAGYGPVPIPCPPGLFRALLGATFWMHLLAVQMFIGLLVISFVGTLRARKTKPDEIHTGTRQLPIVMAVLINLGIPPLLFLQLLYGPFFYTSSILLGYLWMGVIPLLMLTYGGLYVARYAKRSLAPWALGISLALALSIAYIYSNNMSWMLAPAGFQQAYAQGGFGGHTFPDQAQLFARWTWVLAPAFAVAAAWIGAGRGWMLLSALLGLGGGLAFRATCPCAPPDALFLMDGTLSFALAVLVLTTRDPAKLRRSVLAWALLKALSTTLVRDQVRVSTLEQTGFSLSILEQHQLISSTWVAFALFIAFGVAATWAFVWMLRHGRKGLTI